MKFIMPNHGFHSWILQIQQALHLGLGFTREP
jgi:hypothetical protein